MTQLTLFDTPTPRAHVQIDQTSFDAHARIIKGNSKAGRIHAASEKSERLQRVLAELKDGLPWSTRHIARAAYVCAVNSCISELRALGYVIECTRRDGNFYYRLVA